MKGLQRNLSVRNTKWRSMYLLRYLCCLTLLLPTLYGCSSNEVMSMKTRFFLTCINKVYDYQKECMCDLYPKGYRKEDYCSEWTYLRMQGYQVPLDIPNK
jgi:hypothetical protein